MRCLACNKELTDFEATRRYALSQEFLDMCQRCYVTVKDQFKVTERLDLKDFEEIQQEKVPFKSGSF